MNFLNKPVSTKLHQLVKRDIVTMQHREVHPSPFVKTEPSELDQLQVYGMTH